MNLYGASQVLTLYWRLTLLYLQRGNSDPGWFKNIFNSKFYYCENLKTCIAVGYSMAKSKRSNVTNGLDRSQNKAVNLAG
jgi:hypothetical protein